MANRRRLWFLAAIGIVVLLWACEENRFLFGSRFSKNPTEEGGEVPGTDGKRWRDAWTQPPSGGAQIDLIFVGDTSGSLTNSGQEFPALKEAFGGFVSTLASQDIDLCIGTMLGHVSPERAGKLRSSSGSDEDKCLCLNDPNDTGGAGIVDKFISNISNVQGDGKNSEGESMSFSFLKSLDETLRKEQFRKTGCFRDSALLYYLAYSDESDECITAINTPSNLGKDGCSTNYVFDPIGPSKAVDKQCREPHTRAKNCSTVVDGKYVLKKEYTPKGFVAAARTRQGVAGFLAGVVGYVNRNPDATPSSEEEYPHGVIGIVKEAGGDTVDLQLAVDQNQAFFNKEFEQLALQAAKKAKIKTVFDLSKDPCSDSIKVYVDETEITDFVYDGKRRIYVSPTVAGNSGSKVRVEYDIVCD